MLKRDSFKQKNTRKDRSNFKRTKTDKRRGKRRGKRNDRKTKVDSRTNSLLKLFH